MPGDIVRWTGSVVVEESSLAPPLGGIVARLCRRRVGVAPMPSSAPSRPPVVVGSTLAAELSRMTRRRTNRASNASTRTFAEAITFAFAEAFAEALAVALMPLPQPFEYSRPVVTVYCNYRIYLQ